MIKRKPRGKPMPEVMVEDRENVQSLFEELRLAMVSLRTGLWEAARLVYELTRYGYTLAAIKEHAGIEEDISSISRWRIVWEYYCVRLNICSSARRLPIQTLYELRNLFVNHAITDVSIIEDALDVAVGKSRPDAIRAVKQYLGLETDEEQEFVTVKLPKPVYNQFEELRHILTSAAQSAGEVSEVTPAQTIEFIRAFVDELGLEIIRNAWLELHGEVNADEIQTA